MSRLNRVFLIGRLVADPEYRDSEQGSYTTFRLAVNRNQQEVDYFTCVCYGKTAELVATYLHKGRLVFVEGSVQTRRVPRKDGGFANSYYVSVQAVQFLSGSGSGSRLEGDVAEQSVDSGKKRSAVRSEKPASSPPKSQWDEVEELGPDAAEDPFL